MTTSIDLSIDELLLLHENQYSKSNFVFANIKPIGAERKIGQVVTRSTSQVKSSPQLVDPITDDFTLNNFEKNINNAINSCQISSLASLNSSTKSCSMNVHDHFYFSPFNESLTNDMNNELKPSAYQPFHHHLSTIDGSTICSPRSSMHPYDNYNCQQQTLSSSIVRQRSNQSDSNQIQIENSSQLFHLPPNYSTNQFVVTNPCQSYPPNSFVNFSRPIRQMIPVFAAPLQGTRERFQVNSVGRPILRANNCLRSSQTVAYKIRR